MKPKIGFIGLGIMGRHMAGHLLHAEYPLVVYDVVQTNIETLVSLGTKAAASCSEVASTSDIVISMVPDSPDVEKVALGEKGIIESARPGLIYVDMSLSLIHI